VTPASPAPSIPLLADGDHAVAEKYGAWKKKTLYGKTRMGIGRTTFLIGADGRVPGGGTTPRSTTTSARCRRRSRRCDA
jgi:hypothetical protein